MKYLQKILILAAVALLLPALTFAKNISVRFNDTPIRQAMSEIKKLSGYEFVYQKT